MAEKGAEDELLDREIDLFYRKMSQKDTVWMKSLRFVFLIIFSGKENIQEGFNLTKDISFLMIYLWVGHL